MSESSNKEVNKYCGASFNQLLNHNSVLFEAFSGFKYDSQKTGVSVSSKYINLFVYI